MIVGGTNFCLAVSKDRESKEESYFPRSGLLEDIRNITRKSSQALAIFQKSLNDKEPYKNIRYAARGLDIANLKLPEDIDSKICRE